MYIYTIETNKQINTMENLFMYLLVGLTVIFLVASLETIIDDFQEIVKDIKQSINQ